MQKDEFILWEDMDFIFSDPENHLDFLWRPAERSL
jgi:hypothetical protein